jgi:hypothetical protein
LNSPSSCLSLPSAMIEGTHHHTRHHLTTLRVLLSGLKHFCIFVHPHRQPELPSVQPSHCASAWEVNPLPLPPWHPSFNFPSLSLVTWGPHACRMSLASFTHYEVPQVHAHVSMCHYFSRLSNIPCDSISTVATQLGAAGPDLPVGCSESHTDR